MHRSCFHVLLVFIIHFIYQLISVSISLKISSFVFSSNHFWGNIFAKLDRVCVFFSHLVVCV